jgi:twitching motility protein PilT
MPKVVAQLCALPKGLVLVTGPTGSGKSTTLAAMVDLINRTRREHVVSLEDPVEFVHASQASLVNQREVGPHTSSFARAIRAALREDPDIILVGEMRDLETVSLALEAANTGHLVLATLHTSTAISTVERIIGLFPPEEQSRIQVTLADVMRGVVSQVLLRRIGGGRVAALEILIVNAAVSNLIREGKVHQIASSMQTGKAIGNQMLNESLAELVRGGTVEVDEALAKAVDKADLARRLGRSPG